MTKAWSTNKSLPETTNHKVKIGSREISRGKITNEKTSTKTIFKTLARAVKNGSFATQK